MEKVIRLTWGCEHCKDVVVSYSGSEKKYCNCGAAAIKMDLNYTNITGEIKEISRKENTGGGWFDAEKKEKVKSEMLISISEFSYWYKDNFDFIFDKGFDIPQALEYYQKTQNENL